jgi:hypothetical protein
MLTINRPARQKRHVVVARTHAARDVDGLSLRPSEGMHAFDDYGEALSAHCA